MMINGSEIELIASEVHKLVSWVQIDTTTCNLWSTSTETCHTGANCPKTVLGHTRWHYYSCEKTLATFSIWNVAFSSFPNPLAARCSRHTHLHGLGRSVCRLKLVTLCTPSPTVPRSRPKMVGRRPPRYRTRSSTARAWHRRLSRQGCRRGRSTGQLLTTPQPK